MKTARIYKELAALARAAGYDDVTDAAVHAWRKRGMIPSARALGRTKRREGKRIPAQLTSRVHAICRHRYDRGIRDLRIITLLLWLDGESISPDIVRSALTSLRDLPNRFVALVGHPARRAEPAATEADLDAGADATARLLAGLTGTEPADGDALSNAARDALRVATERGDPEEVSDLAPLATALGLARAHDEGLAGAQPWLAGDPASELNEALRALYASESERQVADATDEELERARTTANRLGPILTTAVAMIGLGYPRGDFGFGLLSHAFADSDPRPLLAYVALLRPEDAAALADAFSMDELTAWTDALIAAQSWLRERPELAAEVEQRGVVAVATEGTASDPTGTKKVPAQKRSDSAPESTRRS